MNEKLSFRFVNGVRGQEYLFIVVVDIKKKPTTGKWEMCTASVSHDAFRDK